VFCSLCITVETGLVIFRTDEGMGFDATFLLSIIRVLPYAFLDVFEQHYVFTGRQ
jgi:hypothetical protein